MSDKFINATKLMDRMDDKYTLGDISRECRDNVVYELENAPAERVFEIPEGGMGEVSDGNHTFNSLYHQRAVLFAALVQNFNSLSWKSWWHEDGKECFGGGWFIVGIDTPEGSYTYHYEAKYWDLFKCVELPQAKHWDGHTDLDVTRLLALKRR